MRRYALLGLALLLLLTACRPLAADHEQVSPQDRLLVRFSHVTAENSPKNLGALRFAQDVRQRTNGYVQVQVFPNSELYKDGEEVAALQEGAIHVIAPATGKLAAIDPSWQIFDLPGLFESFADVQRLYDSPVGLEMRKRLEDRGLIALAVWPNGFKQFTNMRRPLLRPEDFSGLTFRVQTALVLQDQFQALDANIVVASFDSVYAEAEQHVIDGQENTLSNIYTRNLQEVQPFLTLSDHGYLSYVVLTQAAWWRSLRPDVREALQASMADATRWMIDNAPALNDEALTKIRASGRVKVDAMTQSERVELQRAMQPAYRATAARLGQDFLDRVLKAVHPDG